MRRTRKYADNVREGAERATKAVAASGQKFSTTEDFWRKVARMVKAEFHGQLTPPVGTIRSWNSDYKWIATATDYIVDPKRRRAAKIAARVRSQKACSQPANRYTISIIVSREGARQIILGGIKSLFKDDMVDEVYLTE